MHIFIYEFITAGGWLLVEPDSPPQGSLLREGLAMLTAATEDFAAIEESRVTILWDARLRVPPSLEQLKNCRIVLIHSPGEHRDQLAACAAQADYALLIAPEFDGHLLSIAEQVVAAGGRLISPNPQFVELASDKQRTSELLASRGVSVPDGLLLEPQQTLPIDFAYPAVLKPHDGAGSLGITYIASDDAIGALPPVSRRSRLEQFCVGQPASIAGLLGPGGFTLLPACSQRLTDDGRFTYVGGEAPLTPDLADRAKRLATQAFSALPATVGYVGLDLVLGGDPSGSDPSGSEDVVIEVNPRLTTSYVGLRAIVQENLAAAMLQIAQGKPVILSLRPGRVEFTAAGEVTHVVG